MKENTFQINVLFSKVVNKNGYESITINEEKMFVLEIIFQSLRHRAIKVLYPFLVNVYSL